LGRVELRASAELSRETSRVANSIHFAQRLGWTLAGLSLSIKMAESAESCRYGSTEEVFGQ